MHLKAIEIEDFQSIKRARLELGKYTVLVGSSDKGKSAIVRAILSVFTNPAGQSKIRTGATKSVVVLEYDDGSRVKYTKSKTSAYELTFPNKKNQSLEKMGREVPAEVQELVTPWQVGDESILVQFQKQIGMDQYFILSPSGGRAGMMRALDDLDAKPYRKALTECQSSVRSMRRETNDLRKQEDNWKEKLEKLVEVDALVESCWQASRKILLMEKIGRLRIAKYLPNLKLVNPLLKYSALKDYEPEVIDTEKLNLLLMGARIKQEADELAVEFREVKVNLEKTDKVLFAEGICPLCKQEVKT